MTGTRTPEFGSTASDYASYRAGFPDDLFDRLELLDIGRRGQVVVDLGTGTGSLARGFARRGCRVVGVDRDRRMLLAARGLDAEAGVGVGYAAACAETVGLRGHSADVVSAGQCWHWFDRAAAAAEVRRLLRPRGRAVIAHFDWIPLPGNVVEATERLIEAHNPDWKLGGGLGVHPAWLRDLGEAGFEGLETFSYDVPVAYSAEGWRGRIRASAGVGASLDAAAVSAFDGALAALLRERFPASTLQVPHRVFAVLGRAPVG